MTDPKALLRECACLIEDMRTEARLHGHITDASAKWLIRLKPRIDAALSAPASGRPCGACEDAALLVELSHAKSHREGIRLQQIAGQIRSSCRHAPTPTLPAVEPAADKEPSRG